MNHLSSIRQRTAIALVVTVQIMSLFVFSAPRISAETVCPPFTGTSAPTGAAARTFVYNPERCLWENDYYTWSPQTKIYSAKYDQTPVLNDAGTAWEYPEWDYSAAQGKYVKRIISKPVPVPAQAQEQPAKTAAQNQQSQQAPQTTETPGLPGVSGAASQTNGTATVSNTGSGSSNTINSNNQTDATVDLINNTSVVSVLDSTAVSGDASVMQNTNGGSATTGDATAIANYVTLLQSGWNPSGGALSTFSTDIFGSFTGDLLFNPDRILNTGDSSTNEINNNNNSDLHLTVSDKASIDNTINLEAVSGHATVSENTNAGDARSGDATAVANLINLINSSINSMQSFIGNINIHGDLNGDLLLPEAIMAQLLGTGYGSQNNINNNNSVDADVNIKTNASITDNINLAAQSGNATVSANTNAGDATTGDASTNVEHQNYIGTNTTRPSGLLVFVNVLGKWVGYVHPGFSSISDTGANSANAINNNNHTDIDADITQDYSITNNINATAISGDATVSRNTNAGSATTGNASAAANVLNIIDSNLNYEDWFGVLFINVFGSWNGGFGVDTAAGGQRPIPGAVAAGGKGAGGPDVLGTAEEQDVSGVAYVARRVMATTASSSGFTTSGSNDNNGAASTSSAATEMLTTSSEQPSAAATGTINNSSAQLWVPAVMVMLGGAIYVGSRQDWAFIRSAISKVR